MAYDFRDHYFQKAKKENFLARAIYKLEEIQKKHRVLRPGDRVLDLGAAPGSWMQLTGGVVGPSGLVVGVDLKKIEHPFPRHVVVLQRDIFDPEFEGDFQREYPPFDVVLSDMAPSTSGIRVADSARSELLFERAIHLAGVLLKPQGAFPGEDLPGIGFSQPARGDQKAVRMG